MNDTDHDGRAERFDAAMRQRHALAATRLSPQVQAQLQQRRVAAMRAGPTHARHRRRIGWSLATASMAALALAFGLQVQRQPTPPSAAPAIVATDEILDTVLDENPDFYLWLASSDANAFASE